MSKRFVLFIVAVNVILVISLSSVLFSRPVLAQGFTGSPNYPFPTQHDLWSVSADGGNTWLDDGHGTKGHVFTVTIDEHGRLPVLTTLHAERYQDTGMGGFLYRELNGQWYVWERSDHEANAQVQSRFHTAIGTVLKPGRYMLTNGTNGDPGPNDHSLLASGYWARP